MRNLHLPGHLQERQFDYDLERYHEAQAIIAEIQPFLGIIPLMVITRRLKTVVDILESTGDELCS